MSREASEPKLPEPASAASATKTRAGVSGSRVAPDVATKPKPSEPASAARATETRDEYGCTPLMLAATNGNEANVIALLKAGAVVDEVMNIYNGLTALMLAAANGREASVTALLRGGAAVNKNNGNCFTGYMYGDTALMFAAENGHGATVALLLKEGAAVDARDKGGKTALTRAAANGREAIVALLLKEGATVDARYREIGDTALMCAAAKGHGASVALLLKAKAAVNESNGDGNTALMLAAKNGHEEIVALLLKAKAAVDKRNIYGNTALMFAAAKGHEASVIALLEEGAAVGERDRDGNTARMLAAANGCKAIVKVIVTSLNTCQSVFAAVKKEDGGAILIRFLEELPKKNKQFAINCILHARNEEGLTALEVAAKNRHVEVVEFLLGLKVDGEGISAETLQKVKTLVEGEIEDKKEQKLFAVKETREAKLRLLGTIREIIIGKIEELESGAATAAGGGAEEGKGMAESAAEQDAGSGTTLVLNPLHGVRSGAAEQDAGRETRKERVQEWPKPRRGVGIGAATRKERVEKMRLPSAIIVPNPLFDASAKPVPATEVGGAGASALKKGAAVDARDIEGNTALMRAAANGHGATVALLLKEGAAVGKRDKHGLTPLMLAAANGSEASVTALLEEGAVVDEVINIYNGNTARMFAADNTALMIAAANGHKAIVASLLKAKAAVDKRNIYGNTALMFAAAKGHEASVTALLEEGAAVGERDRDGNTALMLAAKNGREASVALLLKEGADVEERDGDYNTPLMLAATRGHEAVVVSLLKEGAAVGERDRDGNTARMLASKNGHEAVATSLRTYQRIFAAVKKEDGREILTRFLEKLPERNKQFAINCILHARNEEKLTALEVVAKNCRAGVVKFVEFLLGLKVDGEGISAETLEKVKTLVEGKIKDKKDPKFFAFRKTREAKLRLLGTIREIIIGKIEELESGAATAAGGGAEEGKGMAESAAGGGAEEGRKWVLNPLLGAGIEAAEQDAGRETRKERVQEMRWPSAIIVPNPLFDAPAKPVPATEVGGAGASAVKPVEVEHGGGGGGGGGGGSGGGR